MYSELFSPTWGADEAALRAKGLNDILATLGGPTALAEAMLKSNSVTVTFLRS